MICTHENFSPDGNLIVYHGWLDGVAFIAARDWEGRLVYHCPIPQFKLGHAVIAEDGKTFITDGIDGHISLVRLEDGRVSVRHLCRQEPIRRCVTRTLTPIHG